eukprot:gene33536-46917_t
MRDIREGGDKAGAAAMRAELRRVGRDGGISADIVAKVIAGPDARDPSSA